MKKFLYLDILRVISLFLVIYGHLVIVAGGAKNLAGIVNSSVVLPLLDESLWSAWVFETFLVDHFHTQAACLGVTLFFIITGYLMPMMMERYNRFQFGINRIFRIIPTLIFVMILLSTWLAITQNINVSSNSFFSSVTLMFPYLRIEPVSGVLWTLSIEMFFYIIVFFAGKFTLKNLIFIQTISLGVICISTMHPGNYLLWTLAWQLRYLLIILIGSAIFIAEKVCGFYKAFQIISSAAIMSYIGFFMFKSANVAPSSYESLGNTLLAILIFFIFYCYFLYRPNATAPRVVRFFAELVYPTYLVHTVLGLGCIALLKMYIKIPVVLVFAGSIFSLAASYLIHIFVEKPGIALGRKCYSLLSECFGR